nr:hypothetical protein [Nostoc sp. ChiSLP01]
MWFTGVILHRNHWTDASLHHACFNPAAPSEQYNGGWCIDCRTVLPEGGFLVLAFLMKGTISELKN